jgi:phosphatidate cytidylyltransferase
VLRARVISTIILAPLVLLLAYLGGLFWLAGVLLAGVQAWREMVQMLQRDQFTLDRNLGLFFVIGAIVEAYVYTSGLVTVSLLRPLLAGLIIFSLIWALYYKGEHATANWGVTVASALYLGFLLSHFVSLRERSNGLQWIILAFLLVWTDDVMAYFVGSYLGKHKLWPRISPKKTWEGLIGGSLSVLIAAPLLGLWLLRLNPWLGLLLGVLVAAFDPFGDFAVSLFKRLARVKDSSQLIPGHGGVLDRLDSLLFIFPVVTYFALFIKGP